MATITGALYQQDLEALAGINERVLCAPASMLDEARLHGYDIDAEDFVQNLDWDMYQKGSGWSRPSLSRMLRDRYGVPNISWWIGATGKPFTLTDLERMRASGYIRTARELDALQTLVTNLPTAPEGIFKLAADGTHVIITVAPGFGANTTNHAIILTGYDAEQGTVTVFNPDARDTATEYPESYLREYLSPNGACTVILP